MLSQFSNREENGRRWQGSSEAVVGLWTEFTSPKRPDILILYYSQWLKLKVNVKYYQAKRSLFLHSALIFKLAHTDKCLLELCCRWAEHGEGLARIHPRPGVALQPLLPPLPWDSSDQAKLLLRSLMEFENFMQPVEAEGHPWSLYTFLYPLFFLILAFSSIPNCCLEKESLVIMSDEFHLISGKSSQCGLMQSLYEADSG